MANGCTQTGMYEVQALLHAHSKSKKLWNGMFHLEEVFFCISKRISFLMEYDNESGTFELASIRVVHCLTLMYALIDLKEL